MYTYELTNILFAIKSFKKSTNSLDIFQHLQFNESGTRSSNTNYVIRPPVMPSLLILIFAGYPDCGMHYQP